MTDSELRTAMETHHSESYGWALSCCARSSVDAEAVLQTVYLKVLMGKARYDGKASFKTWLFAVIRRTAADERRRQMLRHLLLERRQVRPAPVAAERPDEVVYRAELQRLVREALAQLPRRQREVLQLVFYHDLSLAEAAQVMNVSLSQVEIKDVAEGLWIWRLEHPRWKPGQGWEPVVASTCVASEGETLVLDPLAPPPDAAEVWRRLDARPPTAVVVLKPDHVRDVDLFVRRYGATAFGPDRFDRHDIPETELAPIYPGSRLPGGLVALPTHPSSQWVLGMAPAITKTWPMLRVSTFPVWLSRQRTRSR
jgi:RNA polymerase sigma-70 factor (ECF subfamily)